MEQAALFLFGAMVIASSGRGEVPKLPRRFGNTQGTKSQQWITMLCSFSLDEQRRRWWSLLLSYNSCHFYL